MFDKLFTPLNIGNVVIPNRLVVTAMVSNFCTADGMATERFLAYHEEKAKGAGV
jgi:2,4-dienoyl-CoA reductase-like NADH-dependent reductase (Old Yellow Enzyme family)